MITKSQGFTIIALLFTILAKMNDDSWAGILFGAAGIFIAIIALRTKDP